MRRDDVAAHIDDAELARIDALATFYGVTREEMIARIVSTGLLHQERQAREARARRDEGGA